MATQTQTLRFDAIRLGATFQMADWTAGGQPVETLYVKTSARKAAVAVEGSVDRGPEFAVKPSTRVKVTITVPDPTPEELAENRRRLFDYHLEHFERSATADLETFSQRFASDPWYAFEWGEAAVAAAARRAVAAKMRAIRDHAEGGVDVAVREAKEQAMRGARWPRRSTSALSNEAHAQMTTAYAEFAEGL